jgi:hypothetical protein
LPGDWFRGERMVRAGVRIGFVDWVTYDYYPSSLWGSDGGGRRESGADGARTRDLESATLALSQLSYGPMRAQCSGEFEVFGPMDPATLVVERGRQAQIHMPPALPKLRWQEKALIQIWRISGEQVDFVACVVSIDQLAADASPGRVRANDNDVAVPRRPLALHTKQTVTRVDDEVVSAALSNGPIDVVSELRSREGHRSFGDVPLLIRREHPRSVVATPDDERCRNRLRRSGRGPNGH